MRLISILFLLIFLSQFCLADNSSDYLTDNKRFLEATEALNGGQFDKAKSDLLILEENGYATSNPLLYFSLGRLYRNIYRSEVNKTRKEPINLSVEYFKKFLTAVKGQEDLERSGLVNLIYAMLDAQSYDQIQPLLGEYKTLHWDDDPDLKTVKAHAMNAIGFEFYKQGKFREARTNFHESVRLKPTWPLFTHNLINSCEGVVDLNPPKGELIGALKEAKEVYDNIKERSYWKKDPKFQTDGSVLEVYLRIYKNLLQ